MTKLTDVDRIALNRAVEIARRDPKEAKWIDTRLAEGDNYWEIAADCARQCQRESLQLQPWEDPPVFGDVERIDPQAADLLWKLLSLNLSRFEPDPARACEAAERAEKKRHAPAK